MRAFQVQTVGSLKRCINRLNSSTALQFLHRPAITRGRRSGEKLKNFDDLNKRRRNVCRLKRYRARDIFGNRRTLNIQRDFDPHRTGSTVPHKEQRFFKFGTTSDADLILVTYLVIPRIIDFTSTS